MTEPIDPRPEYHLDKTDFALISGVDFRLNNVMNILTIELTTALQPGSTFWPDQKVAALRDFFLARFQAIEDRRTNFSQSQNPDVRALDGHFIPVSQQLLAIKVFLDRYLREHNIEALNDEIKRAYQLMQQEIKAVANNPAYLAYSRSQPEENRTTFVYPVVPVDK